MPRSQGRIPVHVCGLSLSADLEVMHPLKTCSNRVPGVENIIPYSTLCHHSVTSPPENLPLTCTLHDSLCTDSFVHMISLRNVLYLHLLITRYFIRLFKENILLGRGYKLFLCPGLHTTLQYKPNPSSCYQIPCKSFWQVFEWHMHELFTCSLTTRASNEEEIKAKVLEWDGFHSPPGWGRCVGAPCEAFMILTIAACKYILRSSSTALLVCSIS